MKKSFFKSNNTWQLATFIVALALLCVFVLPESNIALAEETDWRNGYDEYLLTLDEDDPKDWYFSESYLDVEGAISIINGFLADDSFAIEALKADPIVIAVIDSGIGHGYTIEEDEEISAGSEYIYSTDVEYKLHPIFEDVLLTDDEGNYVYKNVADTVNIISDKDENGDGKKDVLNTMTSVDEGGVVVTDSGNIALDLVDNTSDDHGTHVTGTVAMLIHKLGLEDYIKILPVKANTNLHYSIKDGVARYKAGYNITYLNEAMDFCLENGADIVSMSLTAYGQGEDSGYRFADYVDDMLIVAAAGNNGESVKGYPAYADNVLGVMNFTLDDEGNPVLAGSSNYGQSLGGTHYYDIAAPGTEIISSINGDEYGKLTGTSMSTPITAFTSALGYFRYRGYNNYDYGYELNPLSIQTMISHGVEDAVIKKDGLRTYSYPMLTLTHILTYDFYADNDFLESIGVTPEEGVQLESIEIIDIAKEQYKLGDNERLTLIANPTPANAEKDEKLQWWLEHNGEKTLIGEGWSLEIAIPTTVGAYRIYCAILNDEGEESVVSINSIELEVVYRTPEELKIVTGNTEFAVGETYTFTIPTEHVNPDLALDIVWYVNGEKAGEGKEFNFKPEELSDYKISVSVNGKVIDEIEITTYTEDGWVLFYGAVLLVAALLGSVQGLWLVLPVKVALEVIVGIIVVIIYNVRKRKRKVE